MITINDFHAEYEIMGWIVEYRYRYKNRDGSLSNEFTRWNNTWNHKLYSSEKIAKESIYDYGFGHTEYRVRQVFAKKIESETIAFIRNTKPVQKTI